MSDYISNNMTSIILALIAAIFAASIVVFFVVRIVVKRKRVDSRNTVNQSNNFVGGDQAGRDINKTNSR